MEGLPFAPKEDPEHDDVAPPSDRDREYRCIRVYEAVGRLRRGLAADVARARIPQTFRLLRVFKGYGRGPLIDRVCRSIPTEQIYGII